jgi:hypothetical protein
MPKPPPKKKVANIKNKQQNQTQEQKIIIINGTAQSKKPRKSKAKPKEKQQQQVQQMVKTLPLIINNAVPIMPQPLANGPVNNPLYYNPEALELRHPPPMMAPQPQQLPQPQLIRPGAGYMQVPAALPRYQQQPEIRQPPPIYVNPRPLEVRQEQPRTPRSPRPPQPPQPPVYDNPPPIQAIQYTPRKLRQTTMNEEMDVQRALLSPPAQRTYAQDDLSVRYQPPVATGQPIRQPVIQVQAPREPPMQQERPQVQPLPIQNPERPPSPNTSDLERQAQEALSQLYSQQPMAPRPVGQIVSEFERRMTSNPSSGRVNLGITPVLGETAGIEARNLGAGTSGTVNPDDVKARRLERLRRQLDY